MRNTIRTNKNTLETTFDQSFTSGYCSRWMLNLSIYLEGKCAAQLIHAITFVLAVQFWSSLHRLASYIPPSAWTPHMPHVACPYDICHMPKYAPLWLNMPYLGIRHMSYGHAICGMWGVQALSGIQLASLWRLDQNCTAGTKVTSSISWRHIFPLNLKSENGPSVKKKLGMRSAP